VDVRDELTMNDFLREQSRDDRHQVRLRRRAVPELRDHHRQSDGTSHTSPTCVVPAVSFNGQIDRTVEGPRQEAPS
jgi:hypothetical protein